MCFLLIYFQFMKGKGRKIYESLAFMFLLLLCFRLNCLWNYWGAREEMGFFSIDLYRKKALFSPLSVFLYVSNPFAQIKSSYRPLERSHRITIEWRSLSTNRVLKYSKKPLENPRKSQKNHNPQKPDNKDFQQKPTRN
jgi:hypothetical protein